MLKPISLKMIPKPRLKTNTTTGNTLHHDFHIFVRFFFWISDINYISLLQLYLGFISVMYIYYVVLNNTHLFYFDFCMKLLTFSWKPIPFLILHVRKDSAPLRYVHSHRWRPPPSMRGDPTLPENSYYIIYIQSSVQSKKYPVRDFAT